MRFDEIANAEEQLALWKLVSDGIWSAISQQAKQQVQAKAAKASQPKPKKSDNPKPAPYAPPPPSLRKAPAQPTQVKKKVPPPAANPQVNRLTQRQQALQVRKPLTPFGNSNQPTASKDAENDGVQVEKFIPSYRRQA